MPRPRSRLLASEDDPTGRAALNEIDTLLAFANQCLREPAKAPAYSFQLYQRLELLTAGVYLQPPASWSFLRRRSFDNLARLIVHYRHYLRRCRRCERYLLTRHKTRDICPDCRTITDSERLAKLHATDAADARRRRDEIAAEGRTTPRKRTAGTKSRR